MNDDDDDDDDDEDNGDDDHDDDDYDYDDDDDGPEAIKQVFGIFAVSKQLSGTEPIRPPRH
eukprot:12415266-Karenia_brevis.AAC.1